MNEDLEARRLAALDRLDAREDPPPAPDLPPMPEEVVVFDMRLRMTRRGKDGNAQVLDGEATVLPIDALIPLTMQSAQILAAQDWVPGPVRVACTDLLKAHGRAVQVAEQKRVRAAAVGHAPVCARVAWAVDQRLNGHRGEPPMCTCAPAAGTA